METTVVTLRLPNEIVELLKKYLRKAIVSIENEKPVVVDKSKIPSLEEVVAEVNRTNSPIAPQRFMNYYNREGWVDKQGRPFDWKQMLATWGTYNLERSNKETEKAKATPKVSADAVANFLADVKKEAG